MNLFGLRQSVHTWRKHTAFLFSVTSGVYLNILSIVFQLGYMCHYNKQVIDSSFLDAHGQSASYGDQQLSKIEAVFRGLGCRVQWLRGRASDSTTRTRV